MLPIFVLVIGAVAVFAGISMFKSGAAIRSWPTTQGRIVERGVGPRTTTSGGGTGKTFEPKVKYTYRVGDKELTGTRIGPLSAAYDSSTAKRVVDALPENVTVHYDPQNPSESFLEGTSTGIAIGAIVGGIIALLVAVGMFFVPKS